MSPVVPPSAILGIEKKEKPAILGIEEKCEVKTRRRRRQSFDFSRDHFVVSENEYLLPSTHINIKKGIKHTGKLIFPTARRHQQQCRAVPKHFVASAGFVTSAGLCFTFFSHCRPPHLFIRRFSEDSKFFVFWQHCLSSVRKFGIFL
jgi:hypothetical protein